MPELFFVASKDFFREHTQVCNLAHASAAALWNMRFQVKGYYAEAGYYHLRTKPKQSDLEARFLAGSGLQKADFLSMVDGPSWSDQLALHARANLISTISLFEGWTNALKEEFGLSVAQADGIQWPSSASLRRVNQAGSVKPGIGDVLVALAGAGESDVMRRSIFPVIASGRAYSKLELDALLTCFRAWKEVRNSVVHSGGRANSRAVVAVGNLSNYQPQQLGMRWVPSPLVGEEGAQVGLSFRDVMSFGEVLQRIVVTIDAEMTRTSRAEELMWARWELRRIANYGDASANASKRRARTRLDFRGAELPAPVDMDFLDAAMIQKYGPFLRPQGVG